MIFGSETLDVFHIDVKTLRFGPWSAVPAHDLEDPFTWDGHLEDVNFDGHFFEGSVRS